MKIEIHNKRRIVNALKSLSKSQNGDKFGIMSIKNAAYYYINACAGIYNDSVPRVMQFELSPTDILWFQTMALSVFLEKWLENDENARQTITQYTKKSFATQVECRDTKEGRAIRNESGDLDKAKKMHEVRKLHDMLLRRQNEQAETEQRPINPRFGAKQADLNERFKRYSFVELSILDMWSSSELLLLELWCFEDSLSKQSVPDWLDDSFRIAYTNWHNTLKNIHATYDVAQSAYSQERKYAYRKYVASCMAIRKLEQSYRFGLIATASAMMTRIDLPVPYDFDIAASYWGRYIASENSFVKWNDEALVRQNLSYDVGGYYSKLCDVFGNAKPQKRIEAVKYSVLREFLLDFLDILNEVYPVGKLPEWSDLDFEEAAKFYHHDYPFIADYLNIPMPQDNSNHFFTYCREQFVWLERIEGSPLRTMRNCNTYDNMYKKILHKSF